MQQEDEIHLGVAGYHQILTCTGGGKVFGSILGQMLPKSRPRQPLGVGTDSSSFGGGY